MMDLQLLKNKEIEDMIIIADDLSQKNLEDKMSAHKIYQSLIDKIPNIYEYPYAAIRGELRNKIWKLEKKFNWNDSFYSQFGQDKFINDNFFRSYKNGFFVEIGAYDGISGSNCFYFEKFMNWKGIAIEPSQRQFEYLQKNRSCQCVNKAVTKKIEKKEFIDVIQGYTMMSGIYDASYQKTLDIINADFKTNIQKKIIETSTFNQIVGNNNLIDYLSIDVEGGELEILNSIDFDFYDIKVISVENNYPKEIAFNDLLLEKGFDYFDNIGVDEVYFNKKHLSLFGISS
jgi:FkbM family methyltransferase